MATDQKLSSDDEMPETEIGSTVSAAKTVKSDPGYGHGSYMRFRWKSITRRRSSSSSPRTSRSRSSVPRVSVFSMSRKSTRLQDGLSSSPSSELIETGKSGIISKRASVRRRSKQVTVPLESMRSDVYGEKLTKAMVANEPESEHVMVSKFSKKHTAARVRTLQRRQQRTEKDPNAKPRRQYSAHHGKHSVIKRDSHGSADKTAPVSGTGELDGETKKLLDTEALLETRDIKETLLHDAGAQLGEGVDVWLGSIIDQVQQGKSTQSAKEEDNAPRLSPPRSTPRVIQYQNFSSQRKRQLLRSRTQEPQLNIRLEKATGPKAESFFKVHKPSMKPKAIALEINLAWFAKKKASYRALKGLSKQFSSRLGKRKRRHASLKKVMPLYVTSTMLTSQLLLDQGGVDEPAKLQYAKLADLGIHCVDPANLNCFTALRYLDLSDNYVSMESLARLPSLQKLSLQCNQLRELVIPEGSFALLENLDVSYNILNPMAVIALSSLPLLRKLNVAHNNLEMFPDESCKMGAFPSLKKLYAAGNSLSEMSLIPLSKLPRLERLNLQENFIRGIPEEVLSISNAFCQMEVLHLASNPVVDCQRLTPLKQITKLHKVMLWDTPMAGRVAYDSTGRCLSISSPILHAATEAQEAHQHWLLEKPDTNKLDINHEEKMKYVVQLPKPFQPVIFTEEKMVAAIDKLGQKVAESCPNTVRGEDEHVLAGSTSTIMPKEEGMDPQVAISEAGKMSPHSSNSTLCPSPFILEELQKMQDSESPIPHHMSEANAAVISLKLALKMIPFREPDLNPPSYRMPTRLGVIRFHQERMSLEPPVSSRKRTLSMAHKFATRIENEARADVWTILETMKEKLEEIENHVVGVISEQKSSLNGDIVTCSPTSSLEEAESGFDAQESKWNTGFGNNASQQKLQGTDAKPQVWKRRVLNKTPPRYRHKTSSGKNP